MNEQQKILKRIKSWILFFVFCLVLSGLTAIPVYTQLKWYMDHQLFASSSWVHQWLNTVWLAIKDINERYPIIFYGFDWLAFAHIMIGFAFIGPYKDPIKNEWIIDWAMICCICILPLAFIMGPIRGIPIYHILIDCCFGVIGILPLLYIKKQIQKLK